MTKLLGIILLVLLVVVTVADRFGALSLFYTTGAVAAIVSVAWVVGALLPKEAIGSVVVRAAEFHQSPEVFGRVSSTTRHFRLGVGTCEVSRQLQLTRDSLDGVSFS